MAKVTLVDNTNHIMKPGEIGIVVQPTYFIGCKIMQTDHGVLDLEDGTHIDLGAWDDIWIADAKPGEVFKLENKE